MYAPYNIAIKWIKQRPNEADRDKSIVTVGDFNIPLSINIRMSRQKKDHQVLRRFEQYS